VLIFSRTLLGSASDTRATSIVVADELAEEQKLTFVPFQQAFEDAAKTAPKEFWLWDGIHPHACRSRADVASVATRRWCLIPTLNALDRVLAKEKIDRDAAVDALFVNQDALDAILPELGT